MSSSLLLAPLQATLGHDVVDYIHNECKILVVGSGGIGCELIKNLALSGFQNLHVLDLDTIDVSNLNRQLLFRTHHVGLPKCQVACHVASQMAIITDDNNDNNNNKKTSSVNYIYHHGNVCDDTKYHVNFIKEQKFDLILNGLDNVAARRRVNRLALAAGVILLESGTTGYLGQVSVISKQVSACYECQTQEKPKQYPICTIRSTPSQPVHCIVWAKELHKLLLSENASESMLYEGQEEENGEGQEENGEPSTYMDTVKELRQVLFSEKNEDDTVHDAGASNKALSVTKLTQQLLQKLFIDEIQKQLDMDRYKTLPDNKKPTTLADLPDDHQQLLPPDDDDDSRRIWSTTIENSSKVVSCLVKLVKESSSSSSGGSSNNDDGDNATVQYRTFDKDDDIDMELVTAFSNLRQLNFHIKPMQSLYSAKGIAGNIIPAIATTNAVVAGLQIIQVYHILASQFKKKMNNNTQQKDLQQQEQKFDHVRECCRYINVLRNPTRNGLLLTAAVVDPPNPSCFVCSKAILPLHLTLEHWTLQDFLQRILKDDLGFQHPSIILEDGDCIWEEGDGADIDSYIINSTKKLTDLPCGGIQHGTIVTVEDFSQDLSIEVAITDVEEWPDDDGGENGSAGGEDTKHDNFHKFVVGGKKPVVITKSTEATTSETTSSATATTITASTTTSTTTNGTSPQSNGSNHKNNDDSDDDDDVVIISDPKKRKKAVEDDDGAVPVAMAAKKAKTATNSNLSEVIEID